MDKIIISKIIAHYDNLKGNHHERVAWGSKIKQDLRFHDLLDDIQMYESILDYGCGNGELYKYLNSRGYYGDYCGYDINDNLLNEAVNRFPGSCIVTEINGRYDHVILSGVLSLDVGQTLFDTVSVIKEAYTHCIRSLRFNSISTKVNHRDEGMFYVDPAWMLRQCLDISPRVILKHGTVPYNYSVTIYRDNNWSEIKEVK